MPNYLEGDIAVGGVSVGVSASTGSNFDNVSASASAQGASVSAGPVSFSIGFGGGLSDAQGGGSKPASLHTEYATEKDGEESGPAYGTQDLVFYLQRADIDDNESNGDELVDQGMENPNNPKAPEAGAGVGNGKAFNDSAPGNNPISAGGATGPNGNSKTPMQSGMNQLAMGGNVGGSGTSVGGAVGRSAGGSFAPISGLDFDDSIDLGEFTQNASRFVDVTSSLINAVKRVKELNQSVVNLSLAGSEKMLARLINRGFSPGLDTLGNRDAETILGTLERPSISELSFQLARQVKGRIRTKDIVRAVNDGEIGHTTRKSQAFQQRMGKTGRAPL